jgi:hypothetical protein
MQISIAKVVTVQPLFIYTLPQTVSKIIDNIEGKVKDRLLSRILKWIENVPVGVAHVLKL